MKSLTIAILIPVHNGLQFTSRCLEGLYLCLKNLSDISTYFKIIVIDDGSTDNTSDWIKMNYPETVILFGDGSLWWSGGINKGTHYAISELKSDYILWWNNDIHAQDNYFKQLLSIIEENNTETLIGSKIYYADKPDVIWSMGGIFDPRSGEKYTIGMMKNDSDQFNVIHEADWLPGMGTLVHRSVFEQLGYVNQIEFPQYHGDSDFTFKAKLAGFRIKVYPSLKIWNDKSNSGMIHNNSFNQLFKSLFSIRSNYNIKKDFLFYQKYALTIRAYFPLMRKYLNYIGGFMKWKILSILRINTNPAKSIAK